MSLALSLLFFVTEPPKGSVLELRVIRTGMFGKQYTSLRAQERSTQAHPSVLLPDLSSAVGFSGVAAEPRKEQRWVGNLALKGGAGQWHQWP